MTKTGKNIITWTLIVIAFAAFLIMGLVVTMMLAPGLEIFGIKYVSAKVGKYSYKKQISLTPTNLILKTSDVPVEITIGESGSLGIEYVQNFQGFTKSSDKPYVDITNADGNAYVSGDSTAVINVGEYKKFIWANSMQDFYFKLHLPDTFANKNLTIDSQNSNIKLSSGGTTTFHDLTVKTLGKISLEDKSSSNDKFVISNDFTVQSKSAVVLQQNTTVLGNVVAKLGNESLSITNAVGKDINFTSGSGHLKFNTCRNLTVQTGSGNINKPTSNAISGSLNFKTTSGSAEIGSLGGNLHSVSASSGSLKFDTVAGTITIAAQRTSITLGTVQNATISTTTGDAIINQVDGNIKFTSTANGKFTCGRVIGNANVTTNHSDIIFNNSISGNLTAKTSTGAVKFVSCNNLQAQIGDGSLSCSKTETSGAVVSGNAIITANRGSVKLHSIAGTDNKINNAHGRVDVDVITHNLVVNKSSGTANGVYNIGSVDEIEFVSNTGSITIGQVGSGATIKTNAAVVVGSTGDANNVDVEATYGAITLKNTVGTVRAMSHGAVSVQNKSATVFKLNRERTTNGSFVSRGSGAISATGLKGIVYAYSTRTIELNFADVTASVDVYSGGRDQIRILATNTRYTTVNYHLNTQSTSALCRVYHGTTEAITNGSGTPEAQNNTGSSININVSSKGAPIELKLAA